MAVKLEVTWACEILGRNAITKLSKDAGYKKVPSLG